MISATISTYNREKYLPGVLKSLKEQTLSNDLYEIVLVNNNSPGNTKEIAEQFIAENPQLKISYHLETKQGLSHGRNRGIEESSGKYITFIDDDAFLADDFLEKTYQFFEENQDVSAIGGPIFLHYEDIVPSWENKYLNSLLGYFNLGTEQKVFPKSDYPRGSNMSFRMDLFEKVGMFNVDLGRKGNNLMGSEEKDIFQRVYAHDLKVVYVPTAKVYHCVPIERTTSEFIKRQALGTGKGEWIRVKDEGGISPLRRVFQEIFRWGASFILFFLFTLKGQVAKGSMIVRFRYWVTSGMFKYKRI
ncbi:MAG: glycosyltransferase [Flavobacteriales bacterium]|jgi:glycosyltransferase involved in cell wall biosynthesis|nr:glycosyltransferase [Flavobacteriales bacterium]